MEREAVLRAYRERVCKVADDLLDAELTVAKGCNYLYRVDPPKGKGEKREHVLVTDSEEIKRYLDGDSDSDRYYYITTERPDTHTIRGIFDRTFDKPAQRLEHAGSDGGPLTFPAAISFVIRQQDGAENRT